MSRFSLHDLQKIIDARIRRLFPFALTADQDRAVAEICRDLASERPMQRLLQADVGAGKTAVAVYALLVAVANKHQAALMAPTEVLASQHFRTLDRYLAHSKVRRLLLTGGVTARERKAALAALRQREFAAVVVDETVTACDPAAAEAIWERSGLAIPVQINFALSGAERLIREIKAALQRREREQLIARRAAAAAVEAELNTTLAGLLLQSQLALAEPEVTPKLTGKLELVAELAASLRQRLERAQF